MHGAGEHFSLQQHPFTAGRRASPWNVSGPILRSSKGSQFICQALTTDSDRLESCPLIL